ncbi:MAG: flagella basal body P-ring formation protein FlgA [Novosphingobium sp.]
MKHRHDRARAAMALLAALGLHSPESARAGEAELTDPAAVDRAVAEFTGHAIGVPGGARQPVDRRLRLASCRAPYRLGWYGQPGRTVQVDCPDAGGWRIFVPLAATPASRAGETMIRRGEIITLAYRGGGFTIQQQGEAQENGADGQWIRVMPVKGGEPVRARVERPGLAVIAAH